MTSTFSPVLWITITIGVLLGTLLFLGIRLRWFSRFSRGYLITLILCLVGASLLSALVVGIWSYESARYLLSQQVVSELRNVGDIVQGEIRRDIDSTFTKMKQLATELAPTVESSILGKGDREFRQAQQVDPHLLQLRITDINAKILAEKSVTGLIDPLNRVAVAFSAEGKAFASDPFISSAFKKYVLNLSVPVLSKSGEVVGTLGASYDLEEELHELLDSTKFNVSGYAVVVNSDGRIIAHPNRSRTNDDISGYEAVKLGLQGRIGSVKQLNKAGQQKLIFYRPLKSVASINPKPLLLLTEINQDEADAPLNNMRRQVFLAMAVMAGFALLLAWQVSVPVKRPVQELVHVAESVEQGDLTARAQHESRDEIGQLARAVNNMVQGLQERDRVKEVFGQYVATQVSEKVLKGEVNLGGESRCVTILFSDIRGFTSMSEEMTPTQVVTFLNDYFSEMVEAVFEQGGVLDKFIGDGLMAVFGAFGEVPDHARRAVRAGLRMKALLGKINGDRSTKGKPPIQIGIGIHTDEVILGNIGTRRRLQYTAIGDGVNTSSRVEALNKEFGTTILITQPTYELVKDEFDCREMPSAHLKGKNKPIQFYEVLSAKAQPG